MLSKRERYIAVITAAVLGLLGLNYYVLAPLMESRDQLAAREQVLVRQLSEARKLISASRGATQTWRKFRASGLSGDASTVEGSLLNAMRTWSQESDLPLTSIRPDRVTTTHGLNELAFQASGEGTMRSLAGFLYRAETGTIPLRIHELQIAPRTEGTDDLSVQLRVSTLWEDAKSAAVRPVEIERTKP